MNTNLTFLGLSDKESKIYSALISLGEVNAKRLSQQTKIDRTTIYNIIQSLLLKGLVTQHNRGKILHFSAHDPKHLLYNLQSQELKLKEVLPELISAYRTGSKEVRVKSYHGNEELGKLYESILDIPGLSNYDIICSEQDWIYLNPKYFERFKKRRAEKRIQTRLIMKTSSVAQGRKLMQKESLSETKLLPPAFSPLNFSAGCYILPDRVIFIGYRKEHSATEIFSKETTAFMQNIFNFMWKVIS